MPTIVLDPDGRFWILLGVSAGDVVHGEEQRGPYPSRRAAELALDHWGRFGAWVDVDAELAREDAEIRSINAALLAA